MNRHSLRVLEFEKIREALVERSTFPGGERRLAALGPVREADEVARRLAYVSEIRRVLEDSDLPIHGLPDLDPILREAEPAGAVLSGARIAPVARSLHVVRRLVAYLHERREALPRLSERARSLDGCGELRGEIERRIDPSGEVRDGATPALRRIRRDQESVRGRILQQLQRILRGLAAPGSDPVVTLRNDRYVIQVRRDRLGDLRGVVHGQSGSGASVYLEPSAVVPGNNELAGLRSAEEEEIRRILAELTEEIRGVLPALRSNESALAEMDAYYAAGRFSRDLDAIPALPSEDGAIVVRRGRHPLLEMANEAEGRATVPLDLRLGGPNARTLVITGPNTGGKTVALKTVGLFALMNQAGLHVPAAEGTRFPVFTNVFADIGDEQSIEASLSTFSSHMDQVNEVLREADGSTLVLLDELGVGTDPDEGAALGKAILAELTRTGALTIVTTHYGSLKVFAHDGEAMENASLEFDRETLSPTYRFLQGVPGSSEALAIARRLGFPEPLVEDARRHLGGEREEVENLLHDLQERRRGLDELREELERERREVGELHERTRRRLDNLREEQDRIRREAMGEARRLVERSKAELSEILGAVRSDGAGGKASGRARTRLGEMGNEFERGLASVSEAAREPARPARAEEIAEGTPVLIPRMGWKGVALGGPGPNGKVFVEVGSLRVEAPLSSLEVRSAASTRESSTPRPVLVERSGELAGTELDLRGRTVEEALSEVDRTLDGLVLSGIHRLRIIHGKGTGALRAAITEQLESDRRVKSFRLGEPGEGGTGVTIAVLE